MNQFVNLERDFKILVGEPHYITIEENNTVSFTMEQVLEVVQYWIETATDKGVFHLHFVVSSKSPNYTHYEEVFQRLQFQYQKSCVTVLKDLSDVTDVEVPFTLKTIDEVGEGTFKTIWLESMRDSIHTKETLSIDQLLYAFQTEIGGRWNEHCLVAVQGEDPVGVILPHIEPGTVEEGRLFYLGVVPNMRGKRYGAMLHEKALYILKEIGASYYIGSTDEMNDAMKQVFLTITVYS
ncbi:GNAT family N-acetyltransferase [Bacillus sp. UNC322MFChir4.1]|uniref:GNAT family N-acetyltransferase n=1 Tax=Bacillus sp. UNC322MFChir4.1 TaxID=1449045 RepID=UPI000691BF28|nr:GNAT family N-acetyltransferase [Bacillus sp. UNC322MFChir4.1]